MRLAMAGFILASQFLLMSAMADQELATWDSCSRISNNDMRLDCYDRYVVQLKEHQDGGQQAIQSALLQSPGEEILSSALQATNDDGFNLSVSQFLHLIEIAELDEGGGIPILGWQKLDRNNYVLWLKLRGRTGLAIQYYAKSKKNARAISVLESVVMQGNEVDPGMFIMNIAAMSPE